MSEVSNTDPRLRFPTFHEPIRETKVGDIAKVTSGGTPSRQKAAFWNGNIPWVTTSLIRFNRIQAAEEFITEEGLKNSAAKIFPRGTVIMALYGQGVTRGKVAILDVDATTNQACAAMLIKNEKISSRFLFYELQRRYDELRNLSNDGSQKNLSGDLLKNLAVRIPTLPEQRKIAEFLTAVDGRIGELSQKKALLEDYKKGVMQQLFTQALRFKDDHGNDFPEWEEKKLTDVLKTVSPRGFQIQSSEILQEGRFKVIDQGKALIAGYCDDSAKVMHLRPVIVYGDHTTIIKYVDFEFVVGADGTQILVSIDRKNELKYLYYNLVQNNVTQEGYKRHFSILKGIFMQIPLPAEQTKIANFLTALDRKIESVAQQIRHTQAFKKGLLQQMFV